MTGEDDAGDLVVVGRVVRAHGIRGEVVVEGYGDGAVLAPGLPVRCGGNSLEVAAVRPFRGRWLVHLAGVVDRNAAELLRDAEVEVDAALLEPPGEGRYYVDDLVGCTLEEPDGAVVGEVVDVLIGPTDSLEVDTGSGRALVPMARELLLEVDLAAGRIVMRLPPGVIEATRSAERGDAG